MAGQTGQPLTDFPKLGGNSAVAGHRSRAALFEADEIASRYAGHFVRRSEITRGRERQLRGLS